MKFKELGKDVVARTAKNPLAWSLYKLCGGLSDSFGRIYGHARFTRQIHERDESLWNLRREMFPELTVVGGPFRGMRYPAAQSYGSMLLPKLLGSYESELHPVLEQLFANQYTAIVDIGCAEGYYAVGLSLRFAEAQVYAFDISSNARKLCGDMVRLNGLDGRVWIGGLCDEVALRSIPLGDRALIVSDCEGYESTLFTSAIAELLARHDLIVETHDFIDIDISSRLHDIFARTHQVRSIKSIDDIEKAHTYRYPQLDRYDARNRRLILAEGRPAIMEWLVMTAR
jgi:hypothetical protein